MDTTQCSAAFWRKDAQIQIDADSLDPFRKSPVADTANIDMDKIGMRIVANASPVQRERGVAQVCRFRARHSDINRQRLHVQAVLCHI